MHSQDKRKLGSLVLYVVAMLGIFVAIAFLLVYTL